MYQHNRLVKKKNKSKPLTAVLLIAVVVVGFSLATIKNLLSFPVVQGAGNLELSAKQDEPVKIAWPKYGQSAIGAVGYGVLETSGDKKPQPTASVAKVMTALALLEKNPLNIGDSGPNIKITEADENLFGEYFAKNGTSVRLQAGTEISLYQALQLIMIPSANNVADTSVIWAFGSIDEYSKYANQLAKNWGMNDSNFADASGFSPKTVSTAHDLIVLGEKAMNNPVLSEIARTWEITLPDGSKAQNSNVFLDFEGNGVIGIKTGDTDQAGGVYLTAAKRNIAGKDMTIIATVMGAKTLTQAQQDSMKLLDVVKTGFSEEKIINAGQVVGQYDIAWQGPVDAIIKEDVTAVVWASQATAVQVKLDEIKSVGGNNKPVGELIIGTGLNEQKVPIYLSDEISEPSTGWRIKSKF